MIGAWVAFMENKKAEPIILDLARDGAPVDYDRFFKTFSKLQANKVLGDAAGMIAAQEGRQVLGRFLVKAVCDLYQGNYNPHYLTGLGSTLWIIDRYGKDTSLVNNSMFQYLDFFFDGIK
jgi:hypothetical protein